MRLSVRHALVLASITVCVAAWRAERAAGQEQGRPQFEVDSKTGRAIGAKELAPEDLRKLIEQKAKVIIIDVRDDASYRKETIPGAIHIPLEALPSRLKEIPKDTALVFT